MTDLKQSPNEQWALKRAMILAAVCLVVGMAGGWAIRGLEAPQPAGATNAASAPMAAGTTAGPAAQPEDPARLKQAADAQAAPLIDRLKSDPNNPDLLADVGNLYYDAQQYPIAVDYYAHALKGRPADAAIRTDLGTAYWYMGNADTAIEEFNQALGYQPNSPNTLFNRGMVKWQGKMDGAGALADWKQLLATSPNYEARDKVEKMMAEVEKQTAAHSK